MKNCARLDWSVLKVSLFHQRNIRTSVTHLIHFVIPSQWNKPSIDFYEKVLGAKSMSEWMGMRLEEEEIASLKTFA